MDNATHIQIGDLWFFDIECTGITTGLDAFNDDGRERAVQKPKMEIVLRKSDSFDQVMAQQTRPSGSSSSSVPMAVPA